MRTLVLLSVWGAAAALNLPTIVTRRAALAGTAATTLAAVGMPALADGDVQTTPSGLKYIEVTPGTGGQPSPGQTVSVHYTGWLDDFDSEKKFDSSYDRRKPLQFPVGTGRVIKGWDEGLLGMKVGGKRRLIIPAELGYGSKGAGGIIPPGATLYFDVELLKIL